MHYALSLTSFVMGICKIDFFFINNFSSIILNGVLYSVLCIVRLYMGLKGIIRFHEGLEKDVGSGSLMNTETRLMAELM